MFVCLKLWQKKSVLSDKNVPLWDVSMYSFKLRILFEFRTIVQMQKVQLLLMSYCVSLWLPCSVDWGGLPVTVNTLLCPHVLVWPTSRWRYHREDPPYRDFPLYSSINFKMSFWCLQISTKIHDFFSKISAVTSKKRSNQKSDIR